MTLSISEIAGLLGLPAPRNEAEIATLLTDSRSLDNKPETTLFFAIPTAGNDGHRYVAGRVCEFLGVDPAEQDHAEGVDIPAYGAAERHISLATQL